MGTFYPKQRALPKYTVSEALAINSENDKSDMYSSERSCLGISPDQDANSAGPNWFDQIDMSKECARQNSSTQSCQKCSIYVDGLGKYTVTDCKLKKVESSEKRDFVRDKGVVYKVHASDTTMHDWFWV